MKKMEKPTNEQWQDDDWEDLACRKINELIEWQQEMMDWVEDTDEGYIRQGNSLIDMKKRLDKLEANTPEEMYVDSRTPEERANEPKTTLTVTSNKPVRETSKVTRLEVIDDEDGRVYSRWDARISLDYQDDGKTLKVFVEQDNGKRDSN